MKIQNSPSKPQRVLVEQESGSSVLISTPAWLSLAKKAGKNEVPLSVLEQVYARGLLEAKPHPKNSPEQQAFLRVESFLHQGKAYELDEDLVLETPKVPDGKKHMGIIKAAVQRYETKDEPEKVEEALIGGSFIRRGGVTGAVKRAVFGSGRRSTRATKKPFDYEAEKERIAQRTQAGIEGKAEGKERAKEAAIQRAKEHKFRSSFEKSHRAYKVAGDDESPTLINKIKWRAQDYITNRGKGQAGDLYSDRWKSNISRAHAAWTAARDKKMAITKPTQDDTKFKGTAHQRRRAAIKKLTGRPSRFNASQG